jgi:AcrR family transcriptional regulator
MGKALRTGPTADRFVETTLDLITEEGGAGPVNLRQVSRRMGCAHTNLYNYFPGFQDLLWAAFRRTLSIYGAWLTQELDDSLEPQEYLRRVLVNLASFPQTHPGLYRFIASDRLPMSEIPEDILDTVSRMKQWLSETLRAVSGSELDPEEAAAIADMVLAYVDGETLNLINERVVPGEDVHSRIVGNALRIYRLLVLDATDGRPSTDRLGPPPSYPRLELADHLKGA